MLSEDLDVNLTVVVPVKGRPDLFAPCLASLRNAIRNHGQAELVIVDNDSGDDTAQLIESARADATILRSHAETVGAVRNEGVAAARHRSKVVVFVDSDCVVNPGFLVEVSRIFARNPEIAIAGCKVRSPEDGHWTEVASDDLHRESGDGRRSHINSGCMAIRREIFEDIGGFSPGLPANEDYDLCDRVRDTGREIWQFESLSALHLGNPKTIAGFMRRLRWHGRGAFAADGRFQATPMSLAVIANSAITCGGLTASAIALSVVGWTSAVGILFASITTVPVSVWLMRMKQYRRWIRPQLAIPLMQLTLIARQIGMLDQFLRLRKRRRDALA